MLGFAAWENVPDEGIGRFAAKRGYVADERALGIAVEMFLAGRRSLARQRFRLTLRVSRNGGVC